MDLTRESHFEDWPSEGPRAVREFLRGVRDGGQIFTMYHVQWVQNSGVNQYGAAAHEHRVTCETLRLALAVDQVGYLKPQLL